MTNTIFMGNKFCKASEEIYKLSNVQNLRDKYPEIKYVSRVLWGTCTYIRQSRFYLKALHAILLS